MQPASRPQYYRIKRIVDMVREGSEAGYLPNRGDFRRELEVSPRTLARDLDFLRDEERAPIEYDASRHGYRLTDKSYRLPPVRISHKEAFGFALVRKLLAAFEGTPLDLEMRSVLGKIAESLEGEISVEPEWLSEQVSVLAEDRVEIDPGIWARVVGFLERREVFRADYQTFTGQISNYELHPLHLLTYHGNWYVLAHNPAKGRVGTFALSRFRRIEGTGKNFERPEGFDARCHARQTLGVTGGDEWIWSVSAGDAPRSLCSLCRLPGPARCTPPQPPPARRERAPRPSSIRRATRVTAPRRRCSTSWSSSTIPSSARCAPRQAAPCLTMSRRSSTPTSGAAGSRRGSCACAASSATPSSSSPSAARSAASAPPVARAAWPRPPHC